MVERHNGIIEEIVLKTTKEMDYTSSIVLSWTLYAKNSLQKSHGFSLNQLAFGRNSNFPYVLQDRLPALEGRTTSEVVAQNLKAMHCRRQAFIVSEASEKIRRPLRHYTLFFNSASVFLNFFMD